ncbi:MAG TPA: GNAT family protein [Bordetella sp.]
MPVQIRRLAPDDAPALRDLRLDALSEAPHAFGSSLAEEQAMDLDGFRQWTSGKESALFGAFVGGHLAGMVGMTRQPRSKMRHKAYIWGMYIEPGQRGLGLGGRLLEAALASAAALPGLRQVQLSVNAGNAPAIALYERAGFREYGREPEALCVAGALYDEILMARPIPRS